MFGFAVELGIDDPLHWYNVVGDKIVDAWMGYKLAELDLRNSQSSDMMKPEEALEKLNGNSKHRRAAI